MQHGVNYVINLSCYLAVTLKIFWRKKIYICVAQCMVRASYQNRVCQYTKLQLFLIGPKDMPHLKDAFLYDCPNNM